MLGDAQGRATFLWSSNIKNTGFYEAQGYKVVAAVLLGDTNPRWKKPPVRVNLMLREVGGGEKAPLKGGS